MGLITFRTPLTLETAERVDALVSVDVDSDEREAQLRECRLALQGAEKAPAPRHRTLRRKLRTLRDAAQCGPSGWRNAFLKDIGAASRPLPSGPSSGSRGAYRMAVL